MSDGRVTPDQLRQLVGGEVFTDRRSRVVAGRRGASKMHNRRAYLPAIDRWFDSGRERDAAAELLVRQQQGEIRGLRFQVVYRLIVNGVHVCAYRSDFTFEELTHGRSLSGPWSAWVVVVADAKGFRTDVYKLKRALMKACHGIEIREL